MSRLLTQNLSQSLDSRLLYGYNIPKGEETRALWASPTHAMEAMKKARRAAGMSQTALAGRLGVSRSTVAMWESGGSRPGVTLLPRIARTLGVSLDTLLGSEGRGVRIPVYGDVAAGAPIAAITDYGAEGFDDWVEIDESTAASGSFFALRIRGHSMEPRICDGDVVIVRRQEDADSGDVVIALAGEEATCKKLQKTPAGICLIPFNPAYEPIFYSRRDVIALPLRILGRVTELRGRL